MFGGITIERIDPYIQKEAKLYIDRGHRINSIGKCNFKGCSTNKGTNKRKSSEFCEFEYIPVSNQNQRKNRKRKHKKKKVQYQTTSMIIYGLVNNWIVRDHIVTHHHQTKPLICWLRNLHIASSNMDEKPTVGVINPDWNKNSNPHKIRKYFEVFCIGPQSNCFVTDKIITWVLSKQIHDGIGKGMLYIIYIIFIYYLYIIYTLFIYYVYIIDILFIHHV